MMNVHKPHSLAVQKLDPLDIAKAHTCVHHTADVQTEKLRVKAAIEKGNIDIAKVLTVVTS